MAWMKLSAYLAREFAPGCAPDKRTVVGWIDRGELVGEKRGSQWWVNPDREPPRLPAPPIPDNTDALARKIIEKHAAATS